MKGFREELSGSLGNLPSAFGRAHTNILASLYAALPHILRGTHRMQRHQVARPFADPFGSLTRAFGGSLTDIAGAIADIGAGTPWLGLRRLGRWLLRRRGWCLTIGNAAGS
jgi:hypothetical protein